MRLLCNIGTLTIKVNNRYGLFIWESYQFQNLCKTEMVIGLILNLINVSTGR